MSDVPRGLMIGEASWAAGCHRGDWWFEVGKKMRFGGEALRYVVDFKSGERV